MTNFTYNDIVRAERTASRHLRPGAMAWIVGINAERAPGAADGFPNGVVYSIEFEDGTSAEAHESDLVLVEAQSVAGTRSREDSQCVEPIPMAGGPWVEYFSRRLREAADTGMLSGRLHLIGCPQVFAPRSAETGLRAADPEGTSLWMMDGMSASTRTDVFATVADWLVANAGRLGIDWIICEASYAHPGDRLLNFKPHLVQGDRAFLAMALADASASDVLTLLRSGRSWRELVFAVAWDGQSPLDSIERGIFACDALAGDSLLVGDVASTEIKVESASVSS